MNALATIEEVSSSGLCVACGIPQDSQYFDDSNFNEPPDVGSEVVLARFELPAQYCGVLRYFSQFTDQHGRNAANVQTPGLEWRILLNSRALYPYIGLGHIVNPWGYGSFCVNIRLDEDSTIELVVRGVPSTNIPANPADRIRLVGGRLVGRYWYNASYGDVVSRP
jgi:hypothetical protein